MPPDAEKVRQRRSEDKALKSTSGERLLTSVQQLKDTEIAVDGIVYSLDGFDHPGGDQIDMFGGNDVTIQYKMIHPHHAGSKQLEKMRKVGKIVDYTSEYKFDTEFEREIKREVFKIVRRGREFGTPGYFFRAFAYLGIFFYLGYQFAFVGSNWKLAVVYGVSQALIGMNVQHDANHGAASRQPWVNDLLGLGADWIGGSKWLWQEQHWTHHAYTNHHEKDPDSFGAEPMLLFNDYPLGDTRRTWLHHFQVFFYLPVLAGYWISSVFNPQILTLRQAGAKAVGIRMDHPHVHRSRKYAIFWRLVYIYINCVMPFKGTWSWSVFADIMIMGASESLALAVLFSLSHNFENSDRDPTGDARKSGEPVCWFKSQVETSCTYGGFMSGCLTGGLNFQVEHHLFPRMSSAWYPFIAPKVREICENHGVNYVYYPWVLQNLWSTLQYMHAAGTGSHWKNNPLSGKL